MFKFSVGYDFGEICGPSAYPNVLTISYSKGGVEEEAVATGRKAISR